MFNLSPHKRIAFLYILLPLLWTFNAHAEPITSILWTNKPGASVTEEIINAEEITLNSNYMQDSKEKGFSLLFNGANWDERPQFIAYSTNRTIMYWNEKIKAFALTGLHGTTSIIWASTEPSTERPPTGSENVIKVTVDNEQNSTKFRRFDPKKHVIDLVRINPDQTAPQYVIYANNNMQAPVEVQVKIRDKETGEFIRVTDLGEQGGSSLVTLYYMQAGAPNNKLFLDIDNVGGPGFSEVWHIDRKRNAFSMTLNSIRGTEEQPDAEPLSTRQNDDWDQWNRFVYYVRSTDQHMELKLCARVGLSPDYVNSCEAHVNESATIKALKPPYYPTTDFQGELVRTEHITYDTTFSLYRLSARAFKIHKVDIYLNESPGIPSPYRTAGAVDMASWSEGIPYAFESDKHNSRLIVIPFRASETSDIHFEFLPNLDYGEEVKSFRFSHPYDKNSLYYAIPSSQNSFLRRGTAVHGFEDYYPLNRRYGSIEIFDEHGTMTRLTPEFSWWKTPLAVWQN